MGMVYAMSLVLRIMLVAGALVLAHWTFHDARDRGKSPWLVLLLVILFFPLGLLLWLGFRPEEYAIGDSDA